MSEIANEPTTASRDTSQAELPWYREGLRFECTQCGNCCTGSPGYVWVTDDELQEIAKHLGCSIGEVRLLHTRLARGRTTLKDFGNGDCTFFDPAKRQCKVYEARPQQCRTWPFWNSNLKNRGHWRQVQVSCPGAGHGTLYTLEQIQAQAEIVDV